MNEPAVCNFGFKDLKLNRIEIHCATGNSASQAVPVSLGFYKEGVLRENEWLYDHFVDHIIFGMLASEMKIKAIHPLQWIAEFMEEDPSFHQKKM